MGSIYPTAFHVKRVAVIGAGPCGLAAASYLQAQGAYDKIAVFEQQAQVGGVWNYNAVVPAPNRVPQTSPFCPPNGPSRVAGEKLPVFPSPMYDKLHANLPKTIMKFSDLDFAEDAWIYPGRHDVQDYIISYSQHVRHLIRFCLQVTSVELRTDHLGHDTWRIQARSTVDGQVLDETFDAVVVANGHYSTPFLPDLPNIGPFHQAYPSVITHSHNYHSADAFKDKKTIIVGNGPSGQDIGYQINRVSKGQALYSVRHGLPPDKLRHTGCREMAEIQEFLIEERGVRLKDGTVVSDVDAIVFCTGFRFSLPFLGHLEKEFITNGVRVHGLYQHLFYIPHPTLVFPALNMRIVSFPFSETQAAVFSAVWSNNLTLPPKPEMVRWNKEAEATLGDKLHIFPPVKDAEYMNELHDWAMEATRPGKEPPRWGAEQVWIRTIFPEAKVAFEQQGCKATTLEELGFTFDASQHEPCQ
ncbi:uncharacterized protein UV8b_03810 [Ustilaginoidea virens]|uniref:Uncharacterized protein n=1 Tax=Ustilaginoidea virens TaxID=1159556 RepID=A0A063C2R1_USTVR|nr:uncharacterized protein UV8b_03810 [Ustilaginoidea virens]QUC19569.1 hypothetical protein UV8b_03810 [Ustilaginoidea virens]GAO17279.1 hypothetical protein UVI_02061250 [Ustilaginoidea virens]